jgi:drug/metabolite transporter (DMT)-like permease
LALAVFGPRVRWQMILCRWDFMLSFFWVGVLAHGVANILWLRTIAVGGAGRTGVVAYLTPVLALGYIAVFHRQVPTLYSGVGLGLILLAVALAESHRSKRSRAAAARPPTGD